MRSAPVWLRRRRPTAEQPDATAPVGGDRSPTSVSRGDAYDEGRTLDDKGFWSACYAPHTSMYFDQLGKVRACCQNTNGLMGDVSTQTIRQIWDGAATATMRSALEVRDFSSGCEFCEWHVEQGDEQIVYARNFDRLPLADPTPRWPLQMEFSMTNSCNLMCRMCNGDWSSSIRAKREGRPPLPVVYTDAFFDELADFLPHLQHANFLGGEPFLGREPLRVLDQLADLADRPSVAVTTNGTQWTPRIERICDAVPMSFVVSLDGATKETYETIRIGADFDQVLDNLRRFQSYATQHGTIVTVAHCLMRSNWPEYARFLHLVEDLGISAVGMNQVLFPAHLSLYQMTADELSEVVHAMERQDVGEAASLTTMRSTWESQLDALRHRLVSLEHGGPRIVSPWEDVEEPAIDVLADITPDFDVAYPEDAYVDTDHELLRDWAGGTDAHEVHWTSDGRVESHDPGLFALVGPDLSLVGRPVMAVVDLVDAKFGGSHISFPSEGDAANDITTVFLDEAGNRTLELRCLLRATGDGSSALLAFREPSSTGGSRP